MMKVFIELRWFFFLYGEMLFLNHDKVCFFLLDVCTVIFKLFCCHTDLHLNGHQCLWKCFISKRRIAPKRIASTYFNQRSHEGNRWPCYSAKTRWFSAPNGEQRCWIPHAIRKRSSRKSGENKHWFWWYHGRIIWRHPASSSKLHLPREPRILQSNRSPSSDKRLHDSIG